MRLGDLAEQVATKLVTETSAPVTEAAAIAEEAALQADNSLFTKIRFSWRPEDRDILERIRMAAETMFDEAFGDAITVLDDFFLQLRIPEQRNGIVVRGADGRPVWKKDESGRFVEDWNQLTGQDIEVALVNLERVKFGLVPQVNQLLMEAVYARNVASDVHDDAWGQVMEGTQGDRSARSNRESRQDRYAAYFRYYLWQTADVFLKQIDSFMKTLTNILYWRVRSQK